VVDDGTNAIVNITDAVNLYSYEVVLNFTGTIDENIVYATFLGANDGAEATYSYNLANSSLVYIYGSKLQANGEGVNGSGELFTIAHSGGSMTLWSFTSINTSDISTKADGSFTAFYEAAETVCGDNVCDVGETSDSCAPDCGSIVSGSSGSGGGGGGGGSTATVDEGPRVIALSEKGMIDGTLAGGLERNDRLQFLVASKTGELEQHTITIKTLNLTTKKISIRIASNPVVVFLELGEEIKVDVNEDNVYDIYIRFKAIKDNKAVLYVKKISEPASGIRVSDVTNTGQYDTSDQNNGFFKMVSSIMLLSVILISIILIISKHKKLAKHKKR